MASSRRASQHRIHIVRPVRRRLPAVHRAAAQTCAAPSRPHRFSSHRPRCTMPRPGRWRGRSAPPTDSDRVRIAGSGVLVREVVIPRHIDPAGVQRHIPGAGHQVPRRVAIPLQHIARIPADAPDAAIARCAALCNCCPASPSPAGSRRRPNRHHPGKIAVADGSGRSYPSCTAAAAVRRINHNVRLAVWIAHGPPHRLLRSRTAHSRLPIAHASRRRCVVLTMRTLPTIRPGLAGRRWR